LLAAWNLVDPNISKNRFANERQKNKRENCKNPFLKKGN
jgi:hypothetical protein